MWGFAREYVGLLRDRVNLREEEAGTWCPDGHESQAGALTSIRPLSAFSPSFPADLTPETGAPKFFCSLFTETVIHLSSRYLSNTCSGPGIVPGTGYTG